MEKIGLFVLITSMLTMICLLYSCDQEPLFENDSLEKMLDVAPHEEPFVFAALFPSTNGGSVYCNPRSCYLKERQWGWVNKFGQDLMNSNFILSNMARQMYNAGIRILCAIDSQIEEGKDGLYDAPHRILYFKHESGITSQRIILHELLHAFQAHLAGGEFTEKNESFTEFEVWVMYDVFWYLMYGGFSGAGGKTNGYKNFVKQIASLKLAANTEQAIDGLVEMFETRYKEWAGVSSTTEIDSYYPGLIIYFLRYK